VGAMGGTESIVWMVVRYNCRDRGKCAGCYVLT
jgi:hypothetical protein